MASGVINHVNITQGTRARELYFDFASNGYPFIRFIDQNGYFWQFTVNTTNNELRLETNSSGSWQTVYKWKAD